MGTTGLADCGGFALHSFRSVTQMLPHFGTNLTLLAENSSSNRFLNAQTFTRFELSITRKIKKPNENESIRFWWEQQGSPIASALPCTLSARLPKCYRISVPTSRSSLKTVHRTVFLTLRPSQGSSLLTR